MFGIIKGMDVYEENKEYVLCNSSENDAIRQARTVVDWETEISDRGTNTEIGKYIMKGSINTNKLREYAKEYRLK